MTCYSMIACLCDLAEANTKDKLHRLVKMKPTERIRAITDKHGLGDRFGQLVGEYAWFLNSTDVPKKDAELWVTTHKAEIRRRAPRFGDLTFELLEAVAAKTNTNLRYLVV